MKDNVRMDFLGIRISMDKEFLYLSMIASIEHSCDKLFPDLANSKPISTPIDPLLNKNFTINMANEHL